MRMATRIKGGGLKPLLKLKRIQAERAARTEMLLFWHRSKHEYYK